MIGIDELNNNLPTNIAARQVEAPQKTQEIAQERKTEQLGGTEAELDAGPAYTVEISKKAEELFAQSQNDRNAQNQTQATPEKTAEGVKTPPKPAKSIEQSEEYNGSLRSFSDDELENMVDSGEITRAEYNVEVARRKSHSGRSSAREIAAEQPKETDEQSDSGYEAQEIQKLELGIDSNGEELAKAGIRNKDAQQRENYK